MEDNCEGHGMKLFFSMFLFAAATLIAAPPEVAGTWKAEFLVPAGEQPKIDNDLRFNLQSKDGRLTGHVHMGNWPGDAPVIDGRIDGDRVSFTIYGNSPWKAGFAGQPISSGLPKLTFTGTVTGTQMKLTLLWDSVMLYGTSSGARQYEMKATRLGD